MPRAPKNSSHQKGNIRKSLPKEESGHGEGVATEGRNPFLADNALAVMAEPTVTQFLERSKI